MMFLLGFFLGGVFGLVAAGFCVVARERGQGFSALRDVHEISRRPCEALGPAAQLTV